MFLHKLEVYPEIKKELIEKFDFNVIGDQLGLEPEVEVEQLINLQIWLLSLLSL